MDISRPQRHPLKQREVYVNDGDGIADLQGREASHGLSGTSLPDSEEFPKRHPVQVRNFQRAQLLQNFLKSTEPRRLGRHEGISHHVRARSGTMPSERNRNTKHKGRYV